MPREPPDEDREIHFKLFQEKLWTIEDKVNVLREFTIEHDTELVRLRQLTNLILEKLDSKASRSRA